MVILRVLNSKYQIPNKLKYLISKILILVLFGISILVFRVCPLFIFTYKNTKSRPVKGRDLTTRGTTLFPLRIGALFPGSLKNLTGHIKMPLPLLTGDGTGQVYSGTIFSPLSPCGRELE